jgi:anti-sigma factor (TIGR02949 family)
MSCGNPHELDCGEALAHLYEFIDGEVGTDDHDRIAQHLDECGPCLEEYDVERIVKDIVHRSCEEHAPSALRSRVVAQMMRLRAAQEPQREM